MAVITLWVLTIIVFLLIHSIPGDPIRIMLGLTSVVSDEVVKSLRKEWGLDQALYVQYFLWVRNCISGNLGYSIQMRKPVVLILSPRIINTVLLAVPAYCFGMLLAMVVGVVSAVKPYSLVDHVVSLGSLVGVSMPTFWLGIILITIFSIKLRLLPMAGIGSFRHYILPTLTLGIGLTASMARMVRSALLEALSQPFVAVLRAKGLAEWRVICKHALKASLIPIITMAGFWIASMLSGAVLTETVFAWPGMGRLLVDALLARDYPVVQACILLGGACAVAANLLVDLMYPFIDPRIRYD